MIEVLRTRPPWVEHVTASDFVDHVARAKI
jgi:hypothetical protein